MPDVIQLYNEHVNIVRDYDRIVWAEDFLGQGDAILSKEDLIPNLVAAFSINDRMIAVPYNVADLLLYYNVDYFKQAGYDAAPQTIAEMAEMMSAIVEKTDAEYGLNTRFTSFELASFLTKIGADGTYIGNNNSGRSGYMTELACQDELKAFLNEWQKVVDTGVYKPTKDSIVQEFAQGIHAMIITSSSNIVNLNNLVGNNFTWAVAQIPSVNASDAEGTMPSNGALFVVNRDDEARKAAAELFVEYMASGDAQVMWHEKSGYVPVNVHTVETDAYKAYVEKIPQLTVPYDALMKATGKMVSPFTPNNDAVEDVIKGTMLSFGQGSITAEEAYNSLLDGCGAAFEEYYRVNPID